MFGFGQETPLKEIAPGITRKVLTYSTNLMICELTLQKGASIPMHDHPHEQSTYVVAGRFRYTVGNETKEVAAEDCVLIPGNVPHEITALQDSVAIDIFSPAREDFL